MQAVHDDYGSIHQVSPDHRRYRFAQFAFGFENLVRGRTSRKSFVDLVAKLSIWESPVFFVQAFALLAARALRQVWRAEWLDLAIFTLGQFRRWDPEEIQGDFSNVLDVYGSLS